MYTPCIGTVGVRSCADHSVPPHNPFHVAWQTSWPSCPATGVFQHPRSRCTGLLSAPLPIRWVGPPFLVILSSEISSGVQIWRRPSPLTGPPLGGLFLVLSALRPYKPLKQSSLKHLTLRTAFLVFFASGSRCSKVHALNGLPNDAAFEPDASVSLCFLPHCLAKSQLPGSPSPVISVRSLSSSLAPDDEDRLIGPMRALRAYRKPTEALCSKWRRLLLSWNENYRYHIRQSTVSRWLLEVTTAAYARPGSELFCLLPKAS